MGSAGPIALVAVSTTATLLGLAIVAVLLFGGSFIEKWEKDAPRRKAERAQRNAVKSGSGLLPSTRHLAAVTQVCADGQHARCPGRVRATGSDGVAACTCTCHGGAMSGFCGDVGRHDLCPGVVFASAAGAITCECSCHARAPGDQLEDGTRRLIADNVRVGDRVVLDGNVRGVGSIHADAERPNIVIFRLDDGRAVEFLRAEAVAVV